MMEQFTTYKVQFKVLSSVVTPFHADSLFGTICWSIALLDGEQKLRNFLNLYRTKDTIPMIISDGVLDGYLPKPVIEPLSLEESEELIISILSDDNPATKIKYIDKIKEFKKIRYLPVEYFIQKGGSFSQVDLLKDYLNGGVKLPHRLIEEAYVLRASIDRYSGRAMEGRLFSTEETFYDSKINIYVKLKNNYDFDDKWLKRIFNYIEFSGYGANKSMGKGQIKVESLEAKDDLPHADNPNAFISLSSFVPEGDDPSDGWYIPHLKYGKLGEYYANSSIDKINLGSGEKIGINPFKRPLLMFGAGATFRLNRDERLMPYYGRIIENIHWDNEIVHYGLLFPLGIKLK